MVDRYWICPENIVKSFKFSLYKLLREKKQLTSPLQRDLYVMSVVVYTLYMYMCIYIEVLPYEITCNVAIKVILTENGLENEILIHVHRNKVFGTDRKWSECSVALIVKLWYHK